MVRHLGQHVDRPAGQRLGVAALGIGDGIERAPHRIHQGLGIGQTLVFSREFGPFTFGRPKLVELADLPGQALSLEADLVSAIACLRQALGSGLAIGKALGEIGGVKASLGIDHCPGGAGARQALPGMLTMDVEQVIGHFTQLQQGRRAAVDPGPALALGVEGPAQQQRGAIRAHIKARFRASTKSRLLEPAAQRSRRIEFGADFGADRAFTHQAGVASTTERELQRIDQDRLAGACLACQHRETGMELELQRRHDHEVAQRKPPQHASALARVRPRTDPHPRSGPTNNPNAQAHHTTPSYQRSLRRNVA